MSGYESVIGLEIHVQLATRTKLFCGDRAEFGAEPNTLVCPVCLGLPGALPVLNARAVELAVRAALGLCCTVCEKSVFARKNYFYPDLPKGYQITQLDAPLAEHGWLDLEPSDPQGDAGVVGGDLDASDTSDIDAGAAEESAAGGGGGSLLRVRIRRVHMEEDAGKSVHDRFPGVTAVDLNRAGVPLIEIVTEPDLRSPTDARAFLNRLRQTLEYLEVSDCDMEKGSLRVDANVSLRPLGSHRLGTKTEVKNMNSFANVERALAFEIERQAALLAEGGAVEQVTLLWDEARGAARVMRSKEESHDYRYFPDPDLPPLLLGRETIERIRAALPELPGERWRRFRAEHGLPAYDAGVLTATRRVADYYESVASAAGDAKAASNWVMTEVLAWLNQRQCGIDEFPVAPRDLAALIGLIADGTISTNLARTVFGRMAETGRPPALIVEEEGLAQVTDESRLRSWVDEVLDEHAVEAARYRHGESRLLGFLMGQIMRKSGGKADPRRASELLRDALGH